MENQSYAYYRPSNVSACNEALDTAPVIVNCVGLYSTPVPFTTDSPTGRHDCYLLYLETGAMEARVCGKTVAVSPGDLLLYLPETPYYYTKTNELPFSYYWVHCTGSNLTSLLASCGFSDSGLYHIHAGGNIPTLYQMIFRDFFLDRPFWNISAGAHLTELIVALGRGIHTQQTRSNGVVWLDPALQYIHEHYASDLSIGMLAKMSHVSSGRFCAAFKARTGTSPQSYIVTLRLKNAQTLMLRTNLNVQQIAATVGYGDALYFSRLFKRHTGLTPTEFRQAGKKR